MHLIVIYNNSDITYRKKFFLQMRASQNIFIFTHFPLLWRQGMNKIYSKFLFLALYYLSKNEITMQHLQTSFSRPQSLLNRDTHRLRHLRSSVSSLQPIQHLWFLPVDSLVLGFPASLLQITIFSKNLSFCLGFENRD